MESDLRHSGGSPRELERFLTGSPLAASEALEAPPAWHRPNAPYPRDARLHPLVEAQVQRTPEARAAVCGDRTLSYRELDRRAQALAAQILQKGVRRGDLVPLCLERSLEMIVSLLGVLKAGAAYVPMEPDFPEDRLRYQIQDTGARLLLTQPQFAARLARLGGEQVEILPLGADLEVSREGPVPPVDGAATDPIHVLYTSGTTGRPKGVVLEHRALCNRLVWMQQAYGLTAEDRVLQKTPYTFDVSGWEFFWPLLVGARLVFARPGGHKDPQYLRHLIREAGITVLHFVPSMLRAFLLTEDGAGCPSLKRVVCSGEELPVSLKDLFFEKFPQVELNNLYGPTEAAIDVTAYRCRPEDRLVPIGKPIANTRIHIVDAALKPLPVGQTGELCIAGDGLARGYLNQPELTAEKFVQHPLEPGVRMYRTGDLARWLPDGNLEYLGRADHQIKIRGNRVELGEIEAVLLEQPAVSACAVVASGGELENLKLVAYAVPDARHAAGVARQLRLREQGRLEGIALHALGNGLEVAHLNASETDFLYREIFEANAYRRHGIRLHDGDCVLDVGANIGLFSLALFLGHERLQIHAFEPIPDIHRVLAANAALFGDGWVAHRCGLAETRQTAEFTYYPRLSMVSGAQADADEEMTVVRSVFLREQGAATADVAAGEIEALLRNRLESRSVSCELRTVSDVLREQKLEIVHLLKIDVEKMEERVLQGIEEQDWDKIRQLAIEVHDTDGRLERIQGLLSRRGFAVAVDRDQPFDGLRLAQVYAWRDDSSTPTAETPYRTEAWHGAAEYTRRLREALRAKVPEYMIPAAIVPLAELPLTPNGKIDRKALSRREVTAQRSRRRVLPRSEIEQRLTAIWEELLGLADVGADEGFFELGGNSLLAVRAADRIAKEFGVPYSVVKFLDHGRIRAIGDYLAATQETRLSEAKPGAETAPRPPLARSPQFEAVEAALNRHPSIRQAVVIQRGEGRGEGDLVAFAVPNIDYFRQRNAARGPRERLQQWIEVWEKNYQPTLEDATSSTERLNAIGYVRSDSGAPIAEAELREGIDLVVEQVMDRGPRTLLEIGCGTGMLLYRFAERVDRYLATDLSRHALDHIQASLKSNPRADRVSLFHCDASDLAAVPVEAADVVVINSVIQYFPGIDYLTSLLETLARRLPPKAQIYLGDIRDLRLWRLFHVWALSRQCPPSTPKHRVRRLLADRLRLEKELVIHPAYFRHLTRTLPRVRTARIEPKRGRHPNEFTRFRYDVWLRLDESAPEAPMPTVRAWTPRLGAPDSWTRALDLPPGQGLYMTDLPNRRLGWENDLLEWLDSPGDQEPLADALQALERRSGSGFDPAECLTWAASAGFRASLHWEHLHDDGRFELFLRPGKQPAGDLPAGLEHGFEEVPPLQRSNHPTLMLDWEEHVPELRQALRDAQPDAPLPSRFFMVRELPTRPNGEVDRKELLGRKAQVVQPPKTPPPALDNRALAIIGISAAFAGAADLLQFWNNLRQGVEGGQFCSEAELRALGVPEERIRHPRFVPLRLAIDGRARFDADFFHVSPRQAENMDPQARLLLTHAWQAMEDAGYAAGSLPRTAVFVSAGNNFYPHALGLREAELQGLDGHEAGLFGQPGMIPAWIAHHLGFRGPSLFVQSLCSSSMAGLHLAARCVASGEADTALVGAASLFAPDRIGYVHEPGLLLSPDGRCRPFDAAAAGMVEGEGVCAVLLKRARDAIRDRDHIYALLRGIGVSNDGPDKVGFAAPSLKGQAEAVQLALRDAGVAPETIRYVEAHGNGTPLGDALEVAALTEGYGDGPGRRHIRGLGSTKPAIGNVDTVTGLAGCVKIALCLQEGCFPAIANFRAPHPAIPFADSPFYVVERNESWKPGGTPLRVGQHVYSLGGMNVHAIYEAAPPGDPAPVDRPNGPSLVPLSARNEDRLQAGARRLLAWLKARPEPDADAAARLLVNLAYTLQVGRQAMAARVVFLVEGLPELAEKLERFIGGPTREQGIIRGGHVVGDTDLLQLIGDAQDQRAFAQQRIAEGRWDRVAHLWVRGGAVEWRDLYGVRLPFRISLPTYPFAETEYGLKPRGQAPVPAEVPPPTRATGDTSGRSSANEDSETLVRHALEELLRIPSESLDADRPLGEVGLDSAESIRLCNRLNERHGFHLAPPALFEHSTVRRLAGYLAAAYPARFVRPPALAPAPGSPAIAPTLGPTPLPTGRLEPIAIVGMSGRFPLADDLEEFWNNLRAGRDCVREIPPERWAEDGFHARVHHDPAAAAIRCGGWLAGIDEFDPLFFNLSPREAEVMNPQNRLAMTHVWLAMEDAGYSAASLSGTRTGLFLGTGETGYARLVATRTEDDEHGYLASLPFAGPNRISYYLNLRGPSEAIDSGCSSSLIAVHKAVQALQRGECDLAFAGGVNTVPTPDSHLSFAKMGLLSPTGRCRTFAKDADGFVWGEGVGIVVLKRLSEAEAAGDHIEAILLGSASNHGGRASSFTAPNPAAQAEVVEAACRQAGVSPRSLSFIETHGTATQLGDSVEIEGLKRAFANDAPEPRSQGNGGPVCGLGAIKSNLGHLELAAGIAGLLKTVLQLKHQTWVANLHSEVENPQLDLAGSPFQVIRQTVPWPARHDPQGNPLPRRAGVSSFGVGGVNAHVVLEEYDSRPSRTSTPPRGPYLITLSAKSEPALRAAARRLRHWLRNHPAPDTLDLRSLAYTLQVGRDAMPERWGSLIGSLAELQHRLDAFLDGQAAPGVAFRGRASSSQRAQARTAPAPARSEDLPALLESWVNGAPVDWSALCGDTVPRRLSLPGYPFARERYWIGSPAPALSPSRSSGGHPAAAEPGHRGVVTRLLEKEWRECSLGSGENGESGAGMLVLANEESIALVSGLNGERVVVVGSPQVPGDRVDFTFDFHRASGQEDLVENIVRTCEGIPTVLDLSDLYRRPRTADRLPLGKLVLYQGLIGTFTPRHLLFITQGLQDLHSVPLSLAGAKFIGLFKMLGIEYPHLRTRAVDLDPAASSEPGRLRALVRDELRSTSHEAEVCYRNHRRYAPQLVAREVEAREWPVRAEAVYVVTGGTRGIGLEIARHLVTKGARRLALLGIQPLPPREDWVRILREGEPDAERRRKLSDLLALEGQVELLRLHTGSLTDSVALQGFFDRVRAECGPIAGVVHSAGAYPDMNACAFVTRDLAAMERVFEPKMDGLETLHSLFAADRLDFFVTFSSLSGVVPRLARGLGDYALANCFADHFAAFQHRQNERVEYRTVSWVDWMEAGYATRMSLEEKQHLEESLEEVGLVPFSNQEGRRLFDLALGVPRRNWVLPCLLIPPAFEAAQADLLSGSPRPDGPPPSGIAPASPWLDRLDRHLAQWEAERSAGAVLSPDALNELVSPEDLRTLDPARVHRIHGLLFPEGAEPLASEARRVPVRQRYSEAIRKHLAGLLKIREVNDATPFQDYGLDSISAMVLSVRLGKELQLEVEPAWLVEASTVESLVTRLETEERARSV